MHNLGHLYLCIFKRQPSVRERWAIRIPLPQSGVKPFKSVKNRSRCPSAHPSPVRLRFRRPGARCRDHFFLHCSIPATENPMLRAFANFCTQIFFARKNPTGNIKCVFRPDLCYSDFLYSVFSSKHCCASKTGRISPYREAIPLLKKQQKSDKRNL